MERRSLLKTALASATLSAPAMLPGCFLSPAAAAIRKAAPYVPTVDDAELVEIGREVETLMAEWRPIWEESNRLHIVWVESIRDRRVDHMSREELQASMAAVGYDEAEARNEALVDRLDALGERAWSITPTSSAGLAALAKVARWHCLSPHDQLPDAAQDITPRRLLTLLSAIESFAQSEAVS